MNMIAEGGDQEGYADGQADDGSNTDIYLNMSGDGIEPSIQDDAVAEQSSNVHIIFSSESI